MNLANGIEGEPNGVGSYIAFENDPLGKRDPLGLNAVIVSGGINPNVELDPEHDKQWRNFILAGIAQISQAKKTLAPGEVVEWMVFKPNYIMRAEIEGLDKDFYTKQITDLAAEYGVKLRWFDSVEQFAASVNTDPTGRDRAAGSLITRMDIFSHGSAGSLMFSYGNSQNVQFFGIPSIAQINSEAFAPDAITKSWACYTAAKTDKGASFIEEWHARTGVPMTGTAGKTDYAPVPIMGGPAKQRAGAVLKMFAKTFFLARWSDSEIESTIENEIYVLPELSPGAKWITSGQN